MKKSTLLLLSVLCINAFGQGTTSEDDNNENRTGIYNTFIGHSSGSNSNSAKNRNTAVGYYSGRALSTGDHNTLIGFQSGQNHSSGSRNVFLGSYAGKNNNGSYNVVIGDKAGYDGDGSYNIFIGNGAGRYETGSNKLYIDNSSSATPLIWGDFSNDKMKVNGSLDVTGGIIGSSSFTLSGNLRRTAHNKGHLEGSYNNVGANSTNTNPIYTIGSNYNPGTTTLGNMYGIGYTHKNASFINSTDLGVNPASSWGAYVTADGNARVFLDASQGNGYFKGSVYSQNIISRGTVSATGGNSTNWNVAYSQRGSQIAGTGLTWSGGKLNVTGASTDDQKIDLFSLSGTTLNLSLEGDGEPNKTVNLASLNTDNQDLSLSGNTLSISNDATSVNLSGYLDNTDAQALALAGTNLSISGGNSIDIGSIDTNTQLSDTEIAGMGYIKTQTDNQDLSLSGNTLSLTNDGTTVDLTGYLDNTDDQDASEVTFTSSSGLTSSEVASALDELNTNMSTLDTSPWSGNSGNISFATGQVSIGTAATKPGYELSVAGDIVTEELLIEFEGDWPDYVFEEDYELTPIIDLKKYIQKNNHLPNVPSASQVSENGIEVGQMNKVLLEKIEELTLYMIKQSEEIESLKKQMEELRTEGK